MRTVGYQDKLLTRPRGREQKRIFRLAQDIADTFEAALEGCGLTIDTVSAAGIAGTWSSQVTHVEFTDPLRLTVCLRPGLLVDDLAEISDRIAEAIHVPRVDIVRTRPGWVQVTVHYEAAVSPFCEPLKAPGAVSTVFENVLVGRHENGRELWRSLVEGQHIVVQGQTQSGKSTWCYSLLSQLTDAPDVIVAGSDPSGILLRPWSKRQDQHAGWQALGTQSLGSHEDVFTRAVKLMDARLKALPDGADHVTISESTPLVLFVLEEFPGLLRQLDAKQKARFLALYGRLLSEGAKAGIRVLIIAQRADAEIVGGYERGQCSMRISFAVDNRAAVEMLHAGIDRDVADAQTSALPGEALISLRGQPVARMLGPNLGGSSVYFTSVVRSEPLPVTCL